ncbi:MAG: hypothetical protein K2P50_16510 [Lachnospiraceae bacterium]|nr:hypothetical protein [Lachnospiraceae bacterium]
MNNTTLAFFIWSLCGLLFLARGIYCMYAKKEVPFGFWANADVAPVSNVPAYNRALGKLFTVAGVLFILLGLPLLSGQNKSGIIISILGAMVESIVLMAVYTVKIEGKYRRKKGEPPH